MILRASCHASCKRICKTGSWSIRVEHPGWGPSRIVWQLDREGIEAAPLHAAAAPTATRLCRFAARPARQRLLTPKNDMTIVPQQLSPYLRRLTSSPLDFPVAATESRVGIRRPWPRQPLNRDRQL